MTDSHKDCARCGAILTSQLQKVVCGNSCNECGRYAYRADKPSYLYLLTHQQSKLHKIGIGTVGKDKGYLETLIQAGWIAHGLWHSADKRETFKWEEEIFTQLGSKFSTTNPDQSGLLGRSDKHWVEDVSAQAISVIDLARLINAVIPGKV